MVRKNARRTSIFHWIPPQYTARPKVEIVRSDGTVDDVTDNCLGWEFEDGHTDIIGRFTISIPNPNEEWTGVWVNGNVVYLYIDYAATATSKRFKGRVEKINYTNNNIVLSGRASIQLMMDRKVTKKYSNELCGDILKDLIDSYGSSVFTYNNVQDSTVRLTVNWSEKPFWDCVKELCNATGFGCYSDYDDDFHFGESVLNSQEAIVHDYNMLEITEFADDITYVKNKIQVYGATVDGIQIFKTVKDQDSIDRYYERKLIEKNDNLTDEQQTQEYAEYLLENNKDPPQIGDVTGIMLATIQPNQSIYLSSPMNNLPPNSYQIISYKHTYSRDKGFITQVKVSKESRSFSNIIKTLVEKDNKKNDSSVNPYEMETTRNFYFNNDSGTHSNTEITDGVLKPTAGAGTWISSALELDTNLNSVYPIIIGQTLTGAVVYISGNDGYSWEQLTNKTLKTITASAGQKLKVKVEFSDATTQINSISIQYKLD